MSISENKREEILKDIQEGYIDVWDNLIIEEIFEQIEREHKELQQYKKFGTPKDYWKLNEMCKEYAANKQNIEEVRTKAIDEFAEKMVIMMPGHRQDIEQIAEEMKKQQEEDLSLEDR